MFTFQKYIYVSDLPREPDPGAFYVTTGTERNPDGGEHYVFLVWAWNSAYKVWCLCDIQYSKKEIGHDN